MKRPTVSVYNHKSEGEVVKTIKLPEVFCTPIRDDIVHFVHDNLARNSR